ncbi:MAG TPA: hypothetical protein VNM39_06590 [Verrucomicrobiae bacterium]|nr:hypothetical protein [Verrucomicrobiae bacterium]
MRRAIAALSLLLALAALDAPRSRADTGAIMNGIGLIDYRHKPDFKIGDWVRYQMKSHSELGASDDYELTVMIAGEEDFWGDPGFWVETWVDMPGVPPQTRASLVSYEIFSDTVATQRLLLYTRKMINMLNEDGTPKMDINKPSASTLKARREVQNPVRFSLDTLGTDTVVTPKGTFKPLKVLMKQGTGATQMVGDSSLYTEVRENRTSWYTLEVPITHLAREDIESINAHKSWLTGRSGDALPLAIRDRGLGTARLIDFGHGATARLVPEQLRHTIAQQVAAEKAAAKPKSTTAKPASSGKSGAKSGAGTP